MDDAEARERALEARLRELEERLRRLELAQGGGQQADSRPVPPVATTASPAAPPPPPTPSASGWVVPPRDRPRSTQPVAAQLPPIPGSATAPDAGALLAARPQPRPRVSLADLEARLTGRALAWAGGLALVLGAIFFVSLAFTRGWIGPEARVIIGLVAGAASLAAGAAFIERQNRLLGHVLTPVGLAVISISLVGATRLYALIPVELGLVLALASSIAAAVIAVRADSPIVAAFGLISVLAAPPLLGAPADIATLAFVTVVLVGTTGVALWRSWPWLPSVAFLLAVPQVAVWIIGRPDPLLGVVGLVLFWLINLVAASGEESRRHSDDLSASSATLMLANVAFLVWAGFFLLSDDLLLYRGPFLVLVALAHLAVGLAFVRRDGDADLFGLLTIGTGLAALAMAAPIHFGAAAMPIAWTAEAVALTWVAVRRGHPYSAVAAGVLFVLAGLYLIEPFEGNRGLFGDPQGSDGLAGSVAFFVAGTAVGLWFLRDLSLRFVVVAYAVVVLVLCALARLDGVPLSVSLTAILVVAAVIPEIIGLLPDRPIAWRLDGLIPAEIRAVRWRPVAERALPAALAVAGAASTVVIAVQVYGPDFQPGTSGIPFVDAAGGALGLYLVGLAITAWFQDDERNREPIAAIALIVTAWACARALDGAAVVVAWSILLPVGFGLWRGLRTVATVPRRVLGRAFGSYWTADMVLPVTALFVAGLAALHLWAIDLPIDDVREAVLPTVPFTSGATVAVVSLAAASILTGIIVGRRPAMRASIFAAGGIVAYLVPFEVAPAAVVVLWAALGALSAAGSRRDREGRDQFLGAALMISVAAATVAVADVAPPSRLVVGSAPVDWPMALESLAALGAVTIVLVVIAAAGRPHRWARWIGVLAGASFVYLASVALVDAAAIQVGGSVSADELRTWAQVGLSVLWAVLGLIGFVSGLRWRFAELRHAGLALLGLATVKVFLFDLAALDVAYRVVSLIALGLLLLASAWLWQRHQPRPVASPDDTPA